MNTHATLRGAGSFLGPFGLVVGGSLVTLAIVGVGHPSTPLATGTQPSPTVTTAPATPRPVKSSAKPSPSTSGPSPNTQAVEVATRTGPRLNPASAHKPHSAAAQPTPHPAPTTQQPAAAQCSGQALTVRLLNAACVSLGGSK